MSLATMAVSWVLANPAITAPIVGASQPEQLADSLAAAEKPLPADLKARLDEMTHAMARRRRRAVSGDANPFPFGGSAPNAKQRGVGGSP